MSRPQDLFDTIRTGGRQAIDALVETRASEELFLDFKRSADDGARRHLHDTDRSNYARALSGFANSEGGVIVWGVDCRPGPDGADLARAYHPLVDAPAFLSRLEGATSGCTVPACPNVVHAAVPTDSGPSGFVVSLVPRSHLAPHQCVKPLNYFMRAGSNFVPVPHGVLQGLFGRRRVAPVFHMWSVEPPVSQPVAAAPYSAKCVVGVLLSSFGPGVVRDIFLNVYAQVPGDASTAAYEFPDPKRWTCHSFAGRAYAVSVDAYKLAPEVMAMPVKIHVTLAPPFVGDWHLVLLYGHGESNTSRVEFRVDAVTIDRLTREFSSAASGPRDGRDYVQEVLGLGEVAPQDVRLDA